MTSLSRLAVALCLCAAPLWAHALECKVSEHGGKPNDDGLDTTAFQKAIDTCHAAGGGRVFVSTGRWVIGTIYLKSNIDLHLERGATVFGSANLKDYAPREREPSNSHAEALYDGLILANGVQNTSISGAGVIDGQGERFWDPGFLESGKARPTLPRPMPWIAFNDSKNLSVSGVTFQNSPSYGVAFTRSTDIDVQNIKVLADPRSPNTDGIQLNDSQRATIRAVTISTGDDNIVLKSDDANVEDVVISDSVLTSDDTAFKFGTGSKKAIRRVTIKDTTMVNSRIGVGLFMRRGGLYEDVLVQNVRFYGRSRSSMEWPIYIDVDRRGNKDKLGTIRDVRIDGMRIEGRGNILIEGNPASLMENIELRNIEFNLNQPSDLATIPNKPRGNVMSEVVQGSVDYSKEKSDITLAHIRGLVVDNIRVVGKPEDMAARVPITLIDVVGARISHVDVAPRANTGDPVLVARQSGDVIAASLKVRGESNATIAVSAPAGGALVNCRYAFSECTAAAPGDTRIAAK